MLSKMSVTMWRPLCFMLLLIELGFCQEDNPAVVLPQEKSNDDGDFTSRQGSAIVDSTPMAGMLALALLGSAMTVISKVAPFSSPEQSNDRIDYDSPAVTYAKNVAAFEDRMERRIKNGVRTIKHGARKAQKAFRSKLRETAINSFGVVRTGVNGISRMADNGMRNFARATHNGIRRLGATSKSYGGATAYGVGRMGNGAGTGVARFGTAARMGISRMTDAYRRSLTRARDGLFGVGTRVARTYMRGISRLGTAANHATSRIGHATSGSVSRIGELATEGVSKVAEVATAVPQTISTVANDKKLQDCLLQTMCYVSSPFLSKDRTQRKRMLRSLANLGESDPNTMLDEDEKVTLLHSRNGNDVDTDDDLALKMDDCDVFKCEIASLGRKAYGLVTELRDATRRR